MKIYEYQVKEFFRRYDIPTPRGAEGKTVDEVLSAARSLDVMPVVVKAQIKAGGRGKAGGIRIARTLEETRRHAESLLGSLLVTAQTGPAGEIVNSLLIEEKIDHKRELYVGILVDRATGRPALLVSGEGGVDIEKLAREAPQKILFESIDPAFGLRSFQSSRVFLSLGFPSAEAARCTALSLRLYRLFMEMDCSDIEINPLAVTASGEPIALDAKANIDDNALYRHPDLVSLQEREKGNALEAAASALGLNYIKLHGSVGCMVNGAGLAMATMDLIKMAGAEPANFLDVGGGADVSIIKEGLRIVLADRDVKVLFVNIFGGILRCDTVATAIAQGAKDMTGATPVIVRLEGTNREEGLNILSSSGIDFIHVADLREAALRIKEEVARAG